MQCNPNVLTIISPHFTDAKGFSVGTQSVLVSVNHLSGEETITFKRVDYCSNQANFERAGCALISPTVSEVASATHYQLGECQPSLTPKRHSLVITQSGHYIPVRNNESTPDVVVTVEPISGSTFTDTERGIVPCGFCLDKTWQTTGAERCNQHFVEVEEISNCGNVRWRRTTKRCGYYASVPLPITLDEDCCGSTFMGYLFHPNETRDPDATVAITDCDGKLWGYAYPTAGDGHTLPIIECGKDTPTGYAVNNSATAPQQVTGC